MKKSIFIIGIVLISLAAIGFAMTQEKEIENKITEQEINLEGSSENSDEKLDFEVISSCGGSCDGNCDGNCGEECTKESCDCATKKEGSICPVKDNNVGCSANKETSTCGCSKDKASPCGGNPGSCGSSTCSGSCGNH